MKLKFFKVIQFKEIGHIILTPTFLKISNLCSLGHDYGADMTMVRT